MNSKLRLLTAAFIFACTPVMPQNSPAPAPVQVIGEIQAIHQTEVKCNADGRIKKVHVRQGDQVNAGDLLFEIETSVADTDFSDRKVRAGNAGLVLTVPVIERQIVFAPSEKSTGTTLATLGDVSERIAVAHVRAEDAIRLAPQQPVLITCDTLPAERFRGKVTVIAPVATVQKAIKGFNIQVSVEAPNPKLLPGAPVRLSFPETTGVR